MGERGGIGFWAATAIGVGGMVGGGIFAVLGLSVSLAGGGTPVAFAIAGAVALLTAYAYARLTVAFPNQGGTVVFVDRAFGIDLVTGSLNNLLWIGYVVMLALYAFAFGSYGATFFPAAHQALWRHGLISLAIVAPTLLNLASANLVGKAETWIVGIKVTILVGFGIVGLGSVHLARLAPGTWTPPAQLVAGGMIIFLAYEGFELIANAAGDARDPRRVIPRALFASVIFVIALYVLVSVVAVGSLPVSRIVAAKDYALAEAARPVLGAFGFRLIAAAALLSTFSAINATLYGSARLAYTIAKEGELPSVLEKEVWHRPVEGLVITAVLALALANLADLSSISMMGSAGFLLVFAAVNAANVRLARRTGSHPMLSVAGLLACLFAFGALVWQTARTAPAQLGVLAGMGVLAVAVELAYRRLRGARFHLGRDRQGPAPDGPPPPDQRAPRSRSQSR